MENWFPPFAFYFRLRSGNRNQLKENKKTCSKAKMDMEQVCQWLQANGLKQYCDAFIGN